MYDKFLPLRISVNSSRILCLVSINGRHKGAAVAQSQENYQHVQLCCWELVKSSKTAFRHSLTNLREGIYCSDDFYRWNWRTKEMCEEKENDCVQ